jgi:hypothetical protein
LLQIEQDGRLEVKGQEKTCHVNTNEKKAAVVILPSDKTDFHANKVVGDEEGLCNGKRADQQLDTNVKFRKGAGVGLSTEPFPTLL